MTSSAVDVMAADAPLLGEFALALAPHLNSALLPALEGIDEDDVLLPLAYRNDDEQMIKFEVRFDSRAELQRVLEVVRSVSNIDALRLAPLRWLLKCVCNTALNRYAARQRRSGSALAAERTNVLLNALDLAELDTMRVSSTSYGSLVKISGSAMRKALGRLLGTTLCDWFCSSIREKRRSGDAFVWSAPPQSELSTARRGRLEVFKRLIAAPTTDEVTSTWQYTVNAGVESFGGFLYLTVSFIDSFAAPVGKTFVDWSRRLVDAKIDAGLHYRYMLEAFATPALRDAIRALYVAFARAGGVRADVVDATLIEVCDAFVRPYFYTIALDLANRRIARIVADVAQPVIGRALVKETPRARATAAAKHRRRRHRRRRRRSEIEVEMKFHSYRDAKNLSHIAPRSSLRCIRWWPSTSASMHAPLPKERPSSRKNIADQSIIMPR
jgi:hypothetical protein